MTDCFNKTTKHRFGNPDEPSYIKFGAARDKDPKFNIRSGQLKLLGWVNSGLFIWVFIWMSCTGQRSKHFLNRRLGKSSMRSRNNVEPLAGRSRCVHSPIPSWSPSDKWLLQSLSFLWAGFPRVIGSFLGSRATCCLVEYNSVAQTVTRKHGAFAPSFRLFTFLLSNKAVADGAIAFYLDHIVSVRVARWTYGTEYHICYNPSNPQHAARSETIFTFPSGTRYVPKAFRAMLEKVRFHIY